MGTIKRSVGTALALVAAIVLLGASVFGQESDEARILRERERQARARIKTLKTEQEQLLFQRALAAADSKYLILDLRAGKGTLNYRGRILRNFNLSIAGEAYPAARSKGIATLSGKRDGSPGKRQLVFNDVHFTIRSVHASLDKVKSKKSILIQLGTKDLGAIFYALEVGSLAYVIN